jgi:Na+-transporting NADH:ubiquinone oxidoreductase subunit NqrE
MQFIAAAASSLLSCQPLLISGVTGPITIFNKTIYDIFVKNGAATPGGGFDYLQFIGWVYMWAAILHWISALLNGKFCPRFLSSQFSVYRLINGTRTVQYVRC